MNKQDWERLHRKKIDPDKFTLKELFKSETLEGGFYQCDFQNWLGKSIYYDIDESGFNSKSGRAEETEAGLLEMRNMQRKK